VESTVAEVLILNGLEKYDFYKVVKGVRGKILGEFEGPRGGGASLSGARTEVVPQTYSYSITHYYYLSRINCKSFVWCGLMELRRQGEWAIEEKSPGPTFA
jgi:hypothetical protein